jgi:hypothetical protein
MASLGWQRRVSLVIDTAAVGMRLQVLGHNRYHLQEADTPGVGSMQATGCGNCRCSKPDRLAGMVSV